MATGDLYRAEFKMNVANQPATFILGYEELTSSGGIEQEHCTMISIGVNKAMAELRLVMTEDVTIEGCLTRGVTGSPKAPGRAWLQSVRGEDRGQSIPATKSLLIKHKQQTSFANRNGKTYLTGIPEELCEGNICTSQNFLDAVKTAFDAVININETIPEGTATFRQVVLSQPGPLPGVWEGLPVTSNSLRNLLYNSARRRTRKLGFSRESVPG